ncbi:hypothetical protein EVAR_94779_1 [Eumeta japonica]|uniref:Uncharacterized protein n=1 Tax=Eumeta variegata TaxID=151549 RepID=A0A4C1UIG3_EUMVA|nr:hypothetical protein EVAR_94779_1 [Eumeta japonica]
MRKQIHKKSVNWIGNVQATSLVKPITAGNERSSNCHYEMTLHSETAPTSAKQIELVGHYRFRRLFEMLYIGYSVEAQVGIGVSRSRVNNRILDETGPASYKVRGGDPA